VRPTDVERIAQIAVRAWGPIYASYRQRLGDEIFAALHTGWEARKAESVRNAARTRPGSVYVTDVGGKVIGFTTFHLDEATKVGAITDNAVDPDCQSQGVGTFQHQKVLDLMRQRGMKFAKVGTGLDDGHAAARRSYEKAGFDRRLEHVTYFMAL
jgi:GNAT superfamily N-acetyltransferase